MSEKSPLEEQMIDALRQAFEGEWKCIAHRFLQLARREGYVLRITQNERYTANPPESLATHAFPIRRKVTEPRVEKCPAGGPWVRGDGMGGVRFFETEESAEKDGLGEDSRSGLRSEWIPVINDVAANPTITREIEE